MITTIMTENIATVSAVVLYVSVHFFIKIETKSCTILMFFRKNNSKSLVRFENFLVNVLLISILD